MTIGEIKKTYIIDDDSIFVFVMKKLLEKHHNFGTIVDFKNGLEALEVLMNKDAELPSVILLDLNMPLIDGWQFLDKLETYPFKDQLTVFILSSSIDYNDIEKSKNYSIVKNFVSKPINHEKLDKILSELN
jgi:CheY-like chemotaxis protein